MKFYHKKCIIVSVAALSFFSIQSVVYIPVAHGELIDKVTILEIKREKIVDKEKLHNIIAELVLLETIIQNTKELQINTISVLRKKLKIINHILWVVEDLIRFCEQNSYFDKRFILLARLVYFVNDLRVATKRAICLLAHSPLIEEKEYTIYQ